MPSTVRDWNALEPAVRNSPTLNTFKNRINNNNQAERTRIPKYFENVQTTREGQIYHTRLRLQCSSLNQHLYSKNIVDNPLCSCGLIEDSTHYLLACPQYRTIRQRYICTLHHPLTASVLLNGIPGLVTLVTRISLRLALHPHPGDPI